MSKRRSKEDIFIIVLQLSLVFFAIMAYLLIPDEKIINPVFKTRTEFFLTFTIGLFALVEGLSTFYQLSHNRKRDKIIDLRNELEQVYGPLFSFCQSYIELFEVVGEPPTMSLEAISFLNEKFETYPHVLSTELYDHWKEKIITQNPRLEGRTEYMVGTQFVGDIINEYEEKVDSYRKLVGKE